jgi:hypothetical protein
MSAEQDIRKLRYLNVIRANSDTASEIHTRIPNLYPITRSSHEPPHRNRDMLSLLPLWHEISPELFSATERALDRIR